MSRKALGKGLSALIPERGLKENQGVSLIPVDQIAPNPYQPRKVFSPEALGELVESVRAQGLLQPVLVKRSASGFELIAGERRWRASVQAGLREIPALIKEAGRQESLLMAMIENIQRADFNAVETATGYQVLGEEFGLSQEEIAQRTGKDRATVANYLRLLKLPTAVQEDLSEGRLSMGHARALLGVADRQKLLAVRDRILAKGLSVRETEELVARMASGKRPVPGRQSADPHLTAVENDLKRRLGTRVRITGRGRKGTIQVHYHDASDLDRLLDLLLVGER